MASSLAEHLAKGIQERFGVAVSFTDLIDNELSEVREVMDALRTPDRCWCEHLFAEGPDGEPWPHSQVCERARALYERLAVK